MNLPQSGWWECRIRVNPDDAELGSAALLEAGCSGVWMQDSDFVDDGENAQLKARAQALVTGYFTEAELDEKSCRAKVQPSLDEYHIAGELEFEWMPAQDWAENWRENFPPLEAGPFIVTAPWHKIDTKGAINICIDPGLAFGTGQHPTTHLCLELLAQQYKSTFPATALDVGCGSGILSIALARLAAQNNHHIEITASDLDPWCVSATSENAQQNNVQIKVVEAAGLDWCKSTFDLVLANLMSDVLIPLAPDLAKVTHAKSTLIVSGISLPRVNDVEKALYESGFVTRERCIGQGELRDGKIEEWAALVLSKKGFCEE
jgi:ribosomal protein L11 methyltransferase